LLELVFAIATRLDVVLRFFAIAMRLAFARVFAFAAAFAFARFFFASAAFVVALVFVRAAAASMSTGALPRANTPTSNATPTRDMRSSLAGSPLRYRRGFAL
jgi:hypothetical protein